MSVMLLCSLDLSLTRSASKYFASSLTKVIETPDIGSLLGDYCSRLPGLQFTVLFYFGNDVTLTSFVFCSFRTHLTLICNSFSSFRNWRYFRSIGFVHLGIGVTLKTMVMLSPKRDCSQFTCSFTSLASKIYEISAVIFPTITVHYQSCVQYLASGLTSAILEGTVTCLTSVECLLGGFIPVFIFLFASRHCNILPSPLRWHWLGDVHCISWEILLYFYVWALISQSVGDCLPSLRCLATGYLAMSRQWFLWLFVPSWQGWFLLIFACSCCLSINVWGRCTTSRNP